MSIGTYTRPTGFTRLEMAALTDDALVDVLRSFANLRRHADAMAAMASSEIDARSQREFGYAGLAQKRGLRTSEALVQQITGVSIGDARTLVTVGTAVTSLEVDNPVASRTPWLAGCAAAVTDQRLSLDAFTAIRIGLGEPSERLTIEQLSSAANQLAAEAPAIPLERLAVRARELRAELDEAGVAQREHNLRAQRYLRLTPSADGMTRITGLLDPESAAIIIGALDAVTSPRRGGPRFLDPNEKVRAEALHDGRTLGQLTVDALVDIVLVATLADERKVLGAKRVAVRVVVKATDLKRHAGAGHIEGQTALVSIETVERHICESGAIEATFGAGGQALDLGREQRSYSSRQRIMLSLRDGGCLIPDCPRPPSWTEAHHIHPWQNGGKTDLADGVLLCRHHHMLVHNNHWVIERSGTLYTAALPDGQRIALPLKSPIKL